MTYQPKRDYRFEYISEVIEFIEENQCRKNCFFATDESYGPMCPEISIELILEHPLDVLDDRGDDGVVCLKYTDVDPDHPKLF